MRQMHVDWHGGRVRVTQWVGRRDAPPILAFNGLGAGAELLAPLAEALSFDPHGHTVIAFDPPGVCGSELPSLPYRMPQVAALGAQILDRLGHQSADVIGLSWGGVAAQQFALQYASRCRTLTLAATFCTVHPLLLTTPAVALELSHLRRHRDAEHLRRVAPWLYGGEFASDPDRAHRRLTSVPWATSSGYYLQVAACLGWTALPWLPLIGQPALVLAGRSDPIAPLWHSRVLAYGLRRSQLQVLDDGHLFAVTAAEDTARRIAAFLHVNAVASFELAELS